MDPNAPQTTLPAPGGPDLERLMQQYQQAKPEAATALVEALSAPLFRFFASQMGSRTEAEDMLQETWLRIHRVRQTYRPGEPVLPWVYAIARRVRIDGYRKRRRVEAREMAVAELPETARREQSRNDSPTFDELMGVLPESQREVLTMLKVNGLSLQEVAAATASTVGAVKQKAHRAYERLRLLIESRKASS
jgi:RNA polymerase sigma-70 factor (ECF subfamily)